MRIHFENNGQDLLWVDVDGDNIVTATNCQGAVDAIWRGAKISNAAIGAQMEAYLPMPGQTVMSQSLVQMIE